MEEIKSIDADHLSFKIAANEILKKTSPNFNFQKIAKIGIKSKCISNQEAERLISHGELPRAYYASNVPDTLEEYLGHEAFTKKLLVEQKNESIKAPNQIDTSISFQKFFSNTAKKPKKLPDIKLIQGSRSFHFAKSFQQFSWDESGILKHCLNRSNNQTIKTLKNILEDTEPVSLGNTFHAVVEGSSIYTHWMLDTLPRFLILANQGIDINSFDHVIVATANKPFHKQIIKMLGIDPEKIIERSRIGTYFKCDSFTRVTEPRNGFMTHKSIYDNVVNFVQRDMNKEARSMPKKIYISREKANRRKILNEKKFTRFLSFCGYQTFYFEELDLPEVVNLVSQASCIVAPHGAGLSNLIYASPKTKIVEIFSGHISPEYWFISQQLGLNYNIFQANFPPAYAKDNDFRLENLTHTEKNHMDIVVNISRFRDFLENLDMI